MNPFSLLDGSTVVSTFTPNQIPHSEKESMVQEPLNLSSRERSRSPLQKANGRIPGNFQFSLVNDGKKIGRRFRKWDAQSSRFELKRRGLIIKQNKHLTSRQLRQHTRAQNTMTNGEGFSLKLTKTLNDYSKWFRDTLIQ